jgi:Flp pilus assembly protein TadD
MRQPEEALERFTEAAALDSADSRAKVGRGVALDLLGRHGDAISEYRAVLARQPGNRAAANNLALSLALNGQTDEAIRRLERLAQSAEAPPRVRQNLALVLGLAGEGERAAVIARIDQSPDDAASNQRFVNLIRSLVPASAKGGEQI